MPKGNGQEPALIRVAQAITDGTKIDWDSESQAHKGLRETLERFRIVEKIVSAHREVLTLESPPEAVTKSPIADTTTFDCPTSVPRAGSPRRRWGSLEILELLGSGGFGEVYRAFDPALRREVALKLRRSGRAAADPNGDLFLGEARRLAQVRHSNVLVVHGADRHEGHVGLWTDLLEGKTLEQLLSEQGPFGAQEATGIGIDLCHALAAVHSAGLIHRAVKTANIMRERGGRIVLMDFGSVAKVRRGPDTGRGGGATSGTPLFMAPEQLLSNEAPATTSDIYALGVVLYHLASGRFPVEARDLSELSAKHQRGEKISLRDARSDLPTSFVRVVERALDPDPARRYRTVGEMEHALAASVGALEPQRAPSPPPESPPRPVPWRKRSLVWAAAATVAVAIVASAVLLQRSPPSMPFSAEAAVYRLGDGTEERLLPNASVAPGDRLILEIEGDEDMYVYVLNEDEKGEAWVLFPAGLDLDNPLSPGERHRLPGRQAGNQIAWEVTSAGGTEKFLVIASRHPLEDLERDIAQVPRAAQGRQVTYAPVSSQSVGRLRGVGGRTVVESAPGEASAQVLSGIAESLSSKTARESGIWTWRIQFDNPGW